MEENRQDWNLLKKQFSFASRALPAAERLFKIGICLPKLKLQVFQIRTFRRIENVLELKKEKQMGDANK